jgi:peptidoglycan/xylan/chitin deacetylase (PgdA/CDA1 family)
MSHRIRWSIPVPESLSTRLARKLGRLLPTRPQPVAWPGGVVSFTFDDFPKSALSRGGVILESYGLRGTYYTAAGIAGSINELGPMFDRRDVETAHRRGHEIACHTFRHLDCRDSDAGTLLADIEENATALSDLTGGYRPANFAFPFGSVSFSAKSVLSRRFESCRGTDRGINAGTADFANLRANPVGACGDEASVSHLIDEACAVGGWLIFYTHDLAETPSPFGCTPERFETIVSLAAARCAVLPVRDVVTGLVAPAPAIF